MAAVGDGGGEDEMMQCTQHPFKNTSPGGGICAFCLQDKLGKLVSSSSSSSSTYNSPSFLPLPSSSSPPSFRSDNNNNTTSTTSSSSQYIHRGFGGVVGGSGSGSGGGGGVRPRLPFLLTPKKKNPSVSSFNRSKSTTNVTTRFHTTDFAVNTPRRRGFWSFLHLSHKKPPQQPPQQPPQPQRLHQQVVIVEEEEEDIDSSRNSNENTNNTTTVERKVSRSRSVGCGSRSFSGDLFDRISSGFGDCTLRRVESHREGTNHRHSTSTVMRDKVRCGGLFGGFMMIASSSSSTTSSSSSYLVSGSNNNHNNNNNANIKPKTWGWAFSSPRRAFIKPNNNNNISSTANNNSNSSNDINKAPNLNSIPSLLSVRS